MPSSVVNEDQSRTVTLAEGEAYRVDTDFPFGGDIKAPDGGARIEFAQDLRSNDYGFHVATRGAGNYVRIARTAEVELSTDDSLLLIGTGDRLDVFGSLWLDQDAAGLNQPWLNLDGVGSQLRNFGIISAPSIDSWSVFSAQEASATPKGLGKTILNHGHIDAEIKLYPGFHDSLVVNHGTIVGAWYSEPAAMYQTAISTQSWARIHGDSRVVNHGRIEGHVEDVLLTNRGEIIGNVTTYGDVDGRGGTIAGSLINDADHARTDLRGAIIGMDVEASGHLMLQNATIKGAVRSGDGDDVIDLRGAKQAGVVFGGEGNDRFDARGAEGRVGIYGGDGDDFYRVDGDVNIVEQEGGGLDTVELWSNSDRFSFFLDANIENLRLRGTAERAIGNSLDNRLIGNELDNSINGGGGNDRVYGFGGNDALYASSGVDRLWGGSGFDTFYLGSLGDRDQIMDFEIDADLINLLHWGVVGYDDLDISTIRSGRVLVESPYGDSAIVRDAANILVAEDLVSEHFEYSLG